MEEEFRWCFIGTGKLAHQVATEILKSGKHKIVSVYSRRIEAARQFAEKFGGIAYATATLAMSDVDVDGVYVVTPHNSHYEYTKLAISLKKPVLCEKPFTTDATQAQELFSLAQEQGVYVVEAMWTWFSPVAQQVKDWVSQGEFGEIEKARINYHMNIYKHASRLTDPNLAGGALLDICIYPITYLYRLFGMPINVRCTGVVKQGVDMKEDVELTFSSGLTAIASASICDFNGLERLVIIGSDASLKKNFFHAADRMVLQRKDGSRAVAEGGTNYRIEFDRVAQEIRAGKLDSAYVPHQATVDVLKIMDECRRQMGLVYPFE